MLSPFSLAFQDKSEQPRARVAPWRQSLKVFHAEASIEGQAAAELMEEERTWADFSRDEAAVKASIADGILNSLLDETVALLSSLGQR